MKKTISECSGCTSLSLPCKGRECPAYFPYEALFCDKCLSEEDSLYIFGGSELCRKCLSENFEEITLED